MTNVTRRTALSDIEFVDEHLRPLQPVVVTGEIPTWPAYRRWTWPYLAELLGRHRVDVYDDWFVPTATMSFGEFVAGNIGTGEPTRRRRYVRWFARSGAEDGNWADEAFAALRDDWRHPSFLPTTDYVVPPVAPPARVHATDDAFPYRALFVSAVGARTRLHLDPWTTSAVLCQVVGTKHVQMWSPAEHAAMIRLADEPDPQAALARLSPTYDDVLRAGEILFIPAGWWHQVDTLTDSVSLTWNFVHSSVARALLEHIERHPDDPDLEVASYYLADRLPGGGAEGGLHAAVAGLLEAPAGRSLR